MNQIITSVLLIFLLGYLGFLLLVYLGQPSMIYYPNIPGKDLQATPGEAGLDFEEVQLQTRDGVELHGWYLPATDPEAVLLFLHGNAGNISHRLDSLRIFNALGLSVLIFDYRGYGRSEGRPSEEGTYRDAEAAWSYLVEERGWRAEQIVVFGRSLGAAIAAQLSGKNSPRGLILESAFTSVPDFAAEIYPYLPVRLLSRYHYDTLKHLRRVSCPVLVIHSPDDEIIPFRHGRAVFRAADEPKTFLQISGGHNEGFLQSEPRYVEGLAQFLDSL